MNTWLFYNTGLEHIEYYKYLLWISWPAVSGLFIMYLYFGFQLISLFRKAKVSGAANLPLALTKIGKQLLITLVIVVSYSVMFVKSYPDWFCKPAVITGVVEAIGQDNLVTVRGGEELFRIKAGKNMMTQLKVNDRIKVVYLPTKLEPVKCIILTQQA